MYGLTKKNRIDVLNKIEKQKDFLYSHYIDIGGEKMQLASFTKNTFINPERYIAELQNRVWSLVNFAESRDLVNVFITLTLPSQYHRKKTLRNGKQIRNSKFAHQDLKVFDIYTKKRPFSVDVHEFKVHKSTRLNYWTKKITNQSLFSRQSFRKYERLQYVQTFDDLLDYIDDKNEDIDLFLEKTMRKNVSIYDIHTRQRVFVYQNFVFKQKSIASIPRWTGKFEKISLEISDYLPIVASKKLTDMWTTIRKDRSWKDLNKDDRVYFRVTEPHKDGTPHLHISAWVPKYAVARLSQAIHRLYPAPRADISASYIPQGYELYEKVYKRNGSWNAGYKAHKDDKSYIKIHIDNAVSYLMKYIYKTLDDLRDDKGITEITMWYILHGICRFYTSRTLISLNVYRPLNGLFSLLELTQHFKDETVTVWLDENTNQPRIINYTDEYGKEYIMWQKKDFELKEYDKDDKKPQSSPIKLRTVDVEINGKEYYMYRSGTKLYQNDNLDDTDIVDNDITPVTRMKMVELWNYYHSLDVDDPTLNIKHFGLVQNTMIDRGLLDGESIPLDDYNTDFNYNTEETA